MMFILQQYYRIGIHCLRTIIYYLYWKSKEPGLGIQGVRFRYPDRSWYKVTLCKILHKDYKYSRHSSVPNHDKFLLKEGEHILVLRISILIQNRKKSYQEILSHSKSFKIGSVCATLENNARPFSESPFVLYFSSPVTCYMLANVCRSQYRW